MRLLHFDHNGRLVLTNFSGKTIPPYAILSHRWGDAEVLFDDVANGSYEMKRGYRKIEFCAKQAAKDRLQYFWIDTCCIDKWNLDELSRSINSMFLWYKTAAKCYVFLPDISVSTATAMAQQRDWEASFRASEWFSRGWTLQELIAPESVEFFSLEGKRIGDKRSLEQLVYEITSIPIEALRNYPLHTFTISERIEWAKNRETREGEDKIYCLLGILDVSMPTSYGEGEEKAWERLEVEMNGSALSIIPFSRNSCFVGHESPLAEMETKFFASKQTVIAIVGPGGTGKSQLALELAWRTRERNKNCSVFWIDASSTEGLYESYTSIARKLSIPGWNDEKTDIPQLVKLRLSRKDANQSLLIFDDADSANLASAGLINYLPHSELCSILVTTRSGYTEKVLASPHIIELQEMTPDIAYIMLERYLNASLSRTQQLEAELLLQELSYLPLAIVQAAAYINNRNITLQNYRSQLVGEKLKALNSSSELSKYELQGCGIENPVGTTLLLSMDQIRHDDPLAADYLCLAACVNRKDILIEFLEAPSPREREDAIRMIDSYKLVTRRPAESALDFHQLVHFALRGWLQTQETLDQWTQMAITQISGVFPDHSSGNRSKWRRMLPHATYALSHSSNGQGDKGKMNLVWKCAMALLNDGRYSESQALFLRTLKIREKELGHEHPDTLMSICNLASTYLHLGQWKEAENLTVRLTKTARKVLGDKHHSTLTSMSNLASAYMSQGRWKEAEKLELQVMEIRMATLGNKHLDTLISMGNLASTYMHQGRWKEAEELELQVIEARKMVLSNEHPHILTGKINLASTYAEQGRWKEAEELQVEVMDTRERVLGDEHPDTLLSMSHLALTYQRNGRPKEAELLNLKIIETEKRVLGDEHPETLISIGNLAFMYAHQERWEEAKQLNIQVTETVKKVFGEKHYFTLACINNLGCIYRNQGIYSEAEELGVQVMETAKSVLGDKHPFTLTSMANVAVTLKARGSINRAVSLIEECCELQTVVLGPQHPDTISSRNALDRWLKDS